MKITPVDRWIIDPVSQFISKSSTGGIILIISAILAIIWANSPWEDTYYKILEYKIFIGLHDSPFLDMHVLEWINHGLMSVFFFVVGLELKREMIAGELSNPKNAILPVVSGIGGMIFPALIFTYFNSGSETMNGWGIPMATDLAFALGILYLLGDKIPTSIRIFLTTFSIVDDIGSVIVIALFYTEKIVIGNLFIGLFILLIMIISNRVGVRNIFYYALLGIGGVWLFFLLSGVHPTIAAILAAFTIPADTKINEALFIEKMDNYLKRFQQADPNHSVPTLTGEQLQILEEMESLNNYAMTPLQRLEHDMAPFVAFIIMPIFALANSGVTFGENVLADAGSQVALGVAIGLMAGKMIGIFGVSSLLIKFKVVPRPSGVTFKHLFGVGLISSIGFTMSLFINELAFNPLGEIGATYIAQAKIGIIIASVIGGVGGYLFLAFQKRVES